MYEGTLCIQNKEIKQKKPILPFHFFSDIKLVEIC